MILKRITKHAITLLVLIFLNSKASSQNTTVVHENQQWFQYYNETKLNKHWTLLPDASYRRRDLFDEHSQFLVRVGMDIPSSQTLELLLALHILDFIRRTL